MKVGDLVRCIWQPTVSHIDKENGCAMPMNLVIKGELGLITEIIYSKFDGSPGYQVTFPHLGHTHYLSDSGFEVINESG